MTVAISPLTDEQASGVSMSNAALREDTRRIIRSTPFAKPEGNSFIEAAGAALWRENTVLSTLHEITDGDEARPLEEVAGYNPYSKLKELFDEDTLAQIAPQISRGDFDLVRSDAQLKGTVADMLSEKQRIEAMEGNGLGYFAGSILAAVIDPVTYIPLVGAGAKVGALGRGAIFGLNAALTSSVSEGVLQATQRDRSMTETLMNVGISGVLGGGLGVFAHGAHPKSTIHPRNADNPLRRENLREQGEITVDARGVREELTAAEIKALNDNYVVPTSAAAAGADVRFGPMPTIARKNPKTVIGKAARTVGDFVNSATIKGQVLRAASGPARWIGVRLFDPAGIVMEHNLKGVGNAKSATIVKQSYMAEYEQLVEGMQAETRKLAAEIKKKPSFKDMMLMTQRHLYSMMDDKTSATMRAKYGDDFEKLEAKAIEFAEGIHQQNEVWETRLMENGLLQDPAVVARLESDVKAARDAVKAAGPDHPEIAKLRAERDLAVEKLSTEKQKGAPLGREYGHAQMWNREAIFQAPSEFKAWLHDVLAFQPDEMWLLTNHNMTLKEFNALSPEDARPIREDWAGDEYSWRIEQTELQLEGAKQRLKGADLDLAETLRAFKLAKEDETQITLSEARKRRDALAAQVAANKARRAALEKELRTFQMSADAGRRTGVDRMKRMEKGKQSPKEVTRDQRVARGQKIEGQLADTIDDVMTDPATPLDIDGKPRFQDAGDVKQLTDKVSEQNVSILRAEQNVRQDIDTVSVPTARLQGRATEAEVGLRTLIREAEELDTKFSKLNEQLRETEALHDAVTKARQQLDETVREARKARNIEAKSVSQVKRALRGANKRTPLNELVDDVYEMLSSRGAVPHGIIQRLTAESDRTTGRVKARNLDLDRSQRVAAIGRGWLRDDLSNILHAQTDQLASELSIREALDIGKGRTFESWSDAMDWVERSYQDMIEEAPNQKAKNALEADRHRTMTNLVEARDRLRGGNFIDDGTANGWMRWSVSKVKQAALIRYGSGFLLSSLTDTATFALRHGPVSGNVARYGMRAAKIMARSSQEDPRHLESFIRSVEIGMGAHAVAKRFGTEDALHGSLYGYGIGSGMTRKITSKVDRVGEIMSEVGVHMGGLPIWNTFLKTVAGLATLDELVVRTANFSKLKPNQVADLGTLGIGRTEAEQIAHFIKKYGVKDEAGHFDPRLEDWEGPQGREAARVVEMAVMRDMNRAVNTPDVGDTPRLMNTLHGSLLLTFQTFAFTFMNQYAYPLVQRMSLFRDRQAMMSLGVLLGAATMVLVGKDILNGRDPAERFKEENMTKTLYEIVDRSGMMGFLSPYADSALKLTGIGGGERYARNGWAESLLGVNFSMFQDYQKAGAAAFSDDPDKLRKIFTVVPYATQARLLGRFINQE